MVEKKAAATAEEEYTKTFIPRVHRIGRISMLAAFIAVFLPVLYFVLVKGKGMPLSTYISAGTSIVAVGLGMWISEPLAVWPVLGSAGTYMAYFAGDVSGTRVPVAIASQKAVDSDINSPRGQVATIYGVASSVIVKLLVLLV